MKPFLSESCKRTDRDVGERQREREKARMREEDVEGNREETGGEREKREAGHRRLCENNTF